MLIYNKFSRIKYYLLALFKKKKICVIAKVTWIFICLVSVHFKATANIYGGVFIPIKGVKLTEKYII